MQKIEQLLLQDKMTNILRYLVSGSLIILAIICLGAELKEPEGLIYGFLNGLFWGVIAYGVYSKPHKYSSFAVVFLIFITLSAGLHTYPDLTNHPSIASATLQFASIGWWYITFSFASFICLLSLALYLRSRHIYNQHNKEALSSSNEHPKNKASIL